MLWLYTVDWRIIFYSGPKLINPMIRGLNIYRVRIFYSDSINTGPVRLSHLCFRFITHHIYFAPLSAFHRQFHYERNSLWAMGCIYATIYFFPCASWDFGCPYHRKKYRTRDNTSKWRYKTMQSKLFYMRGTILARIDFHTAWNKLYQQSTGEDIVQTRHV